MAHILVVDEDTAILTALDETLSGAGHRVTRIGTLEHAQLLYRETQPDLVILDVRVDFESGWGWLAEISGNVPTIVLTAHSREEDVIRGLDAGAADYMTKPYRSGELLARVRARLVAPPWVAEAPLPVAATANPSLGGTGKPSLSGGPLKELPSVYVSPTANEPLIAREDANTPANRRRPKKDEEQVFMSEAEEMALLRLDAQAPSATNSGKGTEVLEEGGTIGERLRRERLRRQLTLVQIESDTKVRLSYLQAMEDDKFTLLPRGPVAIEMVRSYAKYLNLNAQAVADDFRRDHYSGPVEFHSALGGPRQPRQIPPRVVASVAAALALVLSITLITIFDPGLYGRLGEQLQALWFWAVSQFQTAA